MTTIDMAKVYVQQLALEAGTTADAVYNKQNDAWYFTKGSVTVEVFFSSYNTVRNTIRTFLRCFAPVYSLPQQPEMQAAINKRILEMNGNFMGVKLSRIADKPFVYAVAERDIQGMDYNEFATTVYDLASWADQLDDLLIQEFGHSTAALN